MGRFRSLFTATLIFALLTSPIVVLSQWGNLIRTPTASAGYTGPGDIVSSAAGWWGLRAYDHALANGGATTTPVIDVTGSTTATSCTIYLLGNGTAGLDFSTAGSGGVGHQCLLGATTFCTVTNPSCTVAKLYDQSGNGITLAASTAPALTFNCVGALPCMTFNAVSNEYLSGAQTAPSQPFTVSWVAERTSVNGNYNSVMLFDTGAIQTGFTPAANSVFIFDGATVTASGNDNVLHSLQGIWNGASSVIYIDGNSNSVSSPGTGTSAGTTTLGGGGNPVNGLIMEAGVWSGAFSGANNAAMWANQCSYWQTSGYPTC